MLVLLTAITAIVAAGPQAGCAKPPPGAVGGSGNKSVTPTDPTVTPGTLQQRISAVDVSGGSTTSLADAIRIAGAGNETVSFAIELSNLPPDAARGQLAVRLTKLANQKAGGTALATAPGDVTVYELVDMPVELNRAGYVRHMGQLSPTTRLPRALVPLTAEGDNFRLSAVAPSAADPDDTKPTTGSAKPAAPRVWVDVRVPATAAAGVYSGSCEVVRSDAPAKGKPATWTPVAASPVELTVHPFTLPTGRSVQLIGQVTRDALVKHFQADFEAVTSRLIARKDPRYAGTVRTLDALMKLAQAHRLSLTFPQLQPTVKWPALVNNAPPDVRWDEFDPLVGPWLDGSAFPDKVGIGYWPLPEPEQLDRLDARSRIAYWTQAASHFDRQEWIDNASVWLRKLTPGRAKATDAIEMSMEAEALLSAHNRLQVSVPLEDGQVQLEDAAQPNPVGARVVDPHHARRLRTAAPALIAGEQKWPEGVAEPRRWLRTDVPGLVPVAGAGGGEQDVRLWAWLAYLRRAEQVMFAETLPPDADPTAAADPADLVWFYPGSWFGRPDLVAVPTVQLKWLRQAEQDFEYLHLARRHGEVVNTLWMARLLTKPVEVGLGQSPDPAYATMTGTVDHKAWADARALLARILALHAVAGEGRDIDQAARDKIEIEILQWARPLERPVLMARTTDWKLEAKKEGGTTAKLALGLDVYNAADVAPGQNGLRWTSMPAGWQRAPQPVGIPPLVPYRVLPSGLDATFNLTKITPAARQPMDVELSVDSPSAKFMSPLSVVAPVAATDRREGRFAFDGKLDDWTEIDLVHSGELVKMISRPAVLAGKLERAATPTTIYSAWADENVYVAFAVEGVTTNTGGSKNFVEYQNRRAWGEDLCEVLIQPIYSDNSLGPVLHVVCKPNGSSWVERKLDPKLNVDPWEPFESTGTRYAARSKNGKWTGELAVPWKILAHPVLELPRALRFNFTQHRSATGESASWAGPVDSGRDDGFTGLLYLPLPVNGVAGEAARRAGETGGAVER